jgi:hypothetical protein
MREKELKKKRKKKTKQITLTAQPTFYFPRGPATGPSSTVSPLTPLSPLSRR